MSGASSSGKAAAPGLAHQAIWLALAKGGSFVVTFLFPLLLARLISKYDMGLYRQSFLMVATALNMLPLGVATSVYYFFPREPDKRQHVVFNVFMFHLAAGLAGWALLSAAPQVMVWVTGSQALIPHGPWIGFVIFTWLFASFLEALATANAEVQWSTLFIVGAQLTKGLFMLAATLWSGELSVLLYAAAAQGLFQSAILLWYVSSRFPGFWTAWDPAFFRRQLAYAVPLGLAGVVYTMFDDLHQYYVSRRYGPEQYAVYSIGCFQVPLVALLRDAIGQLMIARVSYLQRFGSGRDIIALTVRVTRWLAMLYCGVFFLLSVVSAEMLTVLFTAKYMDSLPVMRINLLMMLIGIAMYDPMLRAYSTERFFVLRVRLLLLALLGVVLWTVGGELGLTGVIAVVVAIHLLERVVMLHRVGIMVGATSEDWALLRHLVLRIMAVSAAAGAVAAALRWLLLGAGMRPVLILVACAMVYAPCWAAGLWFSGALEGEEEFLAGYRDKFAARLPAGLRRRLLAK